jgi:uncharacterized protein YukE
LLICRLNNRIVAAQSGWVGSSVLALTAKIATRLEATRRLVTSVGDHATDLSQDGIDFAAMERDAVEKFQALQPTADSSVGLA